MAMACEKETGGNPGWQDRKQAIRRRPPGAKKPQKYVYHFFI